MNTSHSGFILFLILVMGLASCSQKPGEKSLEITASLAIGSAGFTGGLVVSGKNAEGKRFVKTAFGGTKIVVTLPDGSWDVSVVGWDGSAPGANQPPFSGTPHCGRSTINFGAADSYTITANQANCAGTDFSGAPFYNSASTSIYPLKIVTCGSFYIHSNASTSSKIQAGSSSSIMSNFCQNSYHPKDLKAKTKSIKLIPVNKELGSKYEPMLAANPYCVTASDAGVFNIGQQIPVSNLPVMVGFYRDAGCNELEDHIIFPDGIKPGLPEKFDSLFDNLSSDYASPYTANRLLIPDNGIKRGWSPLYDLMPNMKCTNGFCGELYVGSSSAKYTDGIYDFYVDIAYNPTANDWRFISFSAPSNICGSITVPTMLAGNVNKLQTGTCTYADGRITLQIKSTVDSTNCTQDVGDICRSPDAKFAINTPVGEKEIFFAGQRDYNGDFPMRFSHLFEKAFSANNVGTTTCALMNPNNVSISGNNVLDPDIFCQLDGGKPTIYAAPSYDVGIATYKVDGTGSTYGSVDFYDPSSMTRNLIMLPPDTREQLSVLNLMFESIGNTTLLETFKYQGSNHGNDDRSYGSIRRMREMLSPDGPAGLFDSSTTCATLSGIKTISMEKDGVVENYEVEIKNIDATYADWATDLKLRRPTAYCNHTDPFAGSCDASVSANYGRYEKAMKIKKNGNLEEIMFFDCSAKLGYYEGLHSDVEDGKYRREKNVYFWNTQDPMWARFERYSREMEATSSTYSAASLIRNKRVVERASKADNTNKITGRYMEYTLERDPNSGTMNQQVNHLHYFLYDSSGWQHAYSFYNFREPAGVDMFASGTKYNTFSASYLNEVHFCSWGLTFPYNFSNSCNSFSYPSETNNVLDLTQGNYNDVSPTLFDPAVMNYGYFPVSW